MDILKKIIFVFIFGLITPYCYSGEPVTLETGTFRYQFSPEGENISFIDKKTGTDYLSKSAVSYCASIKSGGKKYDCFRAWKKDDRVYLNFKNNTIQAVIEVTAKDNYVTMEVVSLYGDAADSLEFLNIPLTLKGSPDESFAACALSMNLKTRVDQLPVLQTALNAYCYGKFGIRGAKVAVTATPMKDIIPAMQSILSNQNDMPYSKVAGPWADEIPFNHGSYLFNFGKMTESNVDEWISMAKSLGVNQIDNHGGGDFFRFGDFGLNEEKFPQGWDSFKRIVDKLHSEGINSIFHTYAFFIDKRSPYVTPVPNKNLDAFRSFTLSGQLSAESTDIPVVESTKDVSLITGFFEHNSVTLHVDDELIIFTGVTKEPPYKFTGCQRGALGTKPASHEKGAKARHLKECFGLFVPNPESELFTEIAKKHADIVNNCGFDGIYLDAIDGSAILGGADNCWYYADKFVFEIAKNLKRPAGMEMSAMWHHFWQFRTRWQAWDYPRRGHKSFIDLHSRTINGGLLLPLQLGWWDFQIFDPPQIEPAYSDVTEYLGCKLIGYNAGISLTGAIDPKTLQNTPAIKRNVDILRNYEELRHKGVFSEKVRERLREPGKEFKLEKDASGWFFREAEYKTHKISIFQSGENPWRTNNSFTPQPLKLRIEALMSAAKYDDAKGITIFDYVKDGNSAEKFSAKGIKLNIEGSETKSPDGSKSLRIYAENSNKNVSDPSWAGIRKVFAPDTDLSGNQTIGVWIYGDSGGEILNFRLESPRHIAYGALADHYVKIDFTGWRYFSLVETESARHDDYKWPVGETYYHVYRESIDFGHVESFSLWINNVSPGGKVSCLVSPVKALPMVSCSIKNPQIAVNSNRVSFPVTMESGSYIEFYSEKDCKLYGTKGELIKEFKPGGKIPTLDSGENKVTFGCSNGKDNPFRINITVINYGDIIR